MNKIFKPTFLRVLTNSTVNCILFVFLILIGAELFMPFAEQFLFVMAIALETVVALAIIVFTLIERKYSFLSIDKDGINHIMPSSKKRTISIPFSAIKEVKIEGYNVKVYYDDNKKLVIDYYKELKEIKEIIDKNIKK